MIKCERSNCLSVLVRSYCIAPSSLDSNPDFSQTLAILPVITELKPHANGSDMGNPMDLNEG